MSQPQLRQPVVVVLGHVDSGKCVAPDTLLQLGDGRILRAREVFERYRCGEARPLPDGVVHPAEGLYLASLPHPGGDAEPRRVTHVWRRRARRLVRVMASNGQVIETTPEHPFLALTGHGGLQYVEAGRLKPGDRLLIPSRVRVQPWSPGRLEAAISGGLDRAARLLACPSRASLAGMGPPRGWRGPWALAYNLGLLQGGLLQEGGRPDHHGPGSFGIRTPGDGGPPEKLTENLPGEVWGSEAGGCMPQLVLAMPDPVLAGYIRGLFEAVGRVEAGPRLLLPLESPLLLRQLQMALQRFGCHARIIWEPRPQLVVEGWGDVAPFTTQILEGPSGAPGPASPSLGLRDGGAPAFRAVEVVGLWSLEGDFEVYDFTVEGSHNFLANGLVAHNTSLLDRIRGTAVQAREVGGMTQHIGASLFPLETILQIVGPLGASIRLDIRVPGLLVIDTPGHEAFSNLRLRGGSAADLAILVVDALRGFEVQTYESVEILRARRVPFVVALNKTDLIPGWRPTGSLFITEALKRQEKAVLDALDERIYTVMGTLSTLGFNSEAFYRVKDFTRQIAIVPVSAKTGEGVAELLAVLVGLAQQYLRGRLTLTPGPGRGIVLELREEVGLGLTANLILLDGVVRVNDRVVVARRDGPVTARVRALYMPKPLDEMRDPRDRFTAVEEVGAAAGVKLVSPDLEGVLAGSPLYVVGDPALEEELRRAVVEEVRSVIIETDKLGVIVRADTLGSLEALVGMLRSRGVPVRRADVGPATKRDVVEAVTVKQEDPLLAALLLFNVRILPEAEREAALHQIKVFTDPIIYNLVQSYMAWVQEERERREREELQRLTRACSFRVLEGYIFRRSHPAIFGIEVLKGRLKPKDRVMNSRGRFVGEVKQIQDQGRPVAEALAGSRVAISMDEPTVDRDFKEGETLYTMPTPQEIELLKTRYLEKMGEDEREALQEIIEIRRRAGTLL